jgi:hypothetical protein
VSRVAALEDVPPWFIWVRLANMPDVNSDHDPIRRQKKALSHVNGLIERRRGRRGRERRPFPSMSLQIGGPHREAAAYRTEGTAHFHVSIRERANSRQ